MSKNLWKSLLASPIVLGMTVACSASAIASEVEANTATPSVASLEQINQYSSEGSNGLAQVTSVSQLSDVQPTDWAFQALQSLVERYGCIAGYPDGTYRGQRPLTRYEFAAGMNACLDRILEIVGAGGVDSADLEIIRRLQEEFAAELATLRGRVDALEARTAELETNQFSTTTKLNGEVIFNVYGGSQDQNFEGLIIEGPAVSDVIVDGVNSEGEPFEDEDQIAAGYRVHLNFDTSFTGQDLLRMSLQANDQAKLATDPFGFAWWGEEGDDITLDDFFYSFPVTSSVEVIVGLNSISVDDFIVSTISPLDSAGEGGLNDFSGPIQYDLFDNGDVGAGVIIQLTDNLSLDAGYTAGEGKDPADGAGLFNGDYSAIGQLTYLSDFMDAALTYIHSYGQDSRLGLDSNGTVGNTYAGQVNFKFDGFEIGGGASYTDVIELGLTDSELWSWNATLAFPDLGGEGNLLGIYGGLTPTFSRGLIAAGQGSGFNQQTYLVEGFYKYQLTNNISLTPSVIWIINPGGNEDNDDTIIGALRTTFRF